MVVLDTISMNQNFPVELENFWLSTINKTVFQTLLCSRHFVLSGLLLITNTQNLYIHLVHCWCQLGALLHSLNSTAHTRKLMTG